MQPGQLFLYSGPRRFGVLPTTSVGQVLGQDLASGAVHIATLHEELDHLAVDVCHLPVARSQFDRCVRELLETVELDKSSLVRIQRWRERKAVGDVGVFTLPIWRCEEAAWATARQTEPGINSATHFLEYAFPLKGEGGSFNLVEVASRQRPRAVW